MEEQSQEVPEFDGTYMQMANALDAVIVSCSDCSQPEVAFFTRNMTKTVSFPMDRLEEQPYNLALNELP